MDLLRQWQPMPILNDTQTSDYRMIGINALTDIVRLLTLETAVVTLERGRARSLSKSLSIATDPI